MKDMGVLRDTKVQKIVCSGPDSVTVTMLDGTERFFDVVAILDDWLSAHNKRVDDAVKDHDLWNRK